MRYKEDWEMASKRLSAFWDQEILDRACVSVICHDPDDHITLPSDSHARKGLYGPDRLCSQP